MGTQASTQYPFDAALQLDDGASAVTASRAGTVGGVPFVFDTMAGAPGLGSPPILENIRYGAVAVIAMSLLTGGGSDQVAIQGSNDPTFATGVVNLGSSPVMSASGSYKVLFENGQGGVLYRYLRAYDTVTGTVSATRVIFLAPLDDVGVS